MVMILNSICSIINTLIVGLKIVWSVNVINIIIMDNCDTKTNLVIRAWNMKGLSGSSVYATYLLDNSDICVFSEHHLFPVELYKLNNLHPEYECYARSCVLLDDRMVNVNPGYGGIVIMWKSHLSHTISRCSDMGNDRIIVIKIESGNDCIFVIGVYLPQQQCYISDFVDYADQLRSVICRCKSLGDVIIAGDFNCHFGREFGGRCTGKTTKNAKCLNQIVGDYNLNVIDIHDSCKGPDYTFYVCRRREIVY